MPGFGAAPFGTSPFGTDPTEMGRYPTTYTATYPFPAYADSGYASIYTAAYGAGIYTTAYTQTYGGTAEPADLYHAAYAPTH
jgi:hypothetical protein